MTEAQEIIIQRTARYYQSGPLDFKYDRVCFALHGYGQLAKYFLRPFQSAEIPSTLFIAPEGLHRFYLQGSKGRVGASWMTKEDRLTDIADYVAYLDQLYAQFKPQIDSARQVGVLGFSQGVATACRWVAESANHFDFLINYAGAFPPDLNHQKALPRMDDLDLKMCVGNDDEYITEEKFELHLQEVRQKGYEAKSFVFEGKHKVYPEVLQRLFGEL